MLMCDICRYSPCDSNCPNAPPNPIIYHCTQCDELIRQGDIYYTDCNDNKFCSEECVFKYYDIEEVEWYDE